MIFRTSLFLKGAEAAIYGSMGANGVILIETDGATSDNMNTEISYYGQFGMSWNDKRIPLLSGIDYKSFLSDMGMNYYGNMENFFNNFPFMNDAEGKNGYLYNNNTNWQDELYRNGFVTDNLFRIEGGDNIAKYDLSLGYANEQGILKSTKQDRYHTQLNGNFLVSKNFEVYATIGLAYMNGHFKNRECPGIPTRFWQPMRNHLCLLLTRKRPMVTLLLFIHLIIMVSVRI